MVIDGPLSWAEVGKEHLQLPFEAGQIHPCGPGNTTKPMGMTTEAQAETSAEAAGG